MKLVTKKHLYGTGLLFVVMSIIGYAFSKTSWTYTYDTTYYLIFNAFWAVAIVLIDKFFHEDTREELETLRVKINKIRGMTIQDTKTIAIDSIRSVLDGTDEKISAVKAKNFMEKKISDANPLSSSKPVNLNLV